MEIGKTSLLAIEPLDAVSHIVEERHILLLTPHGIIKELGHKQRDGQFLWLKGNGREGIQQAHVGEFLQLESWPDIGLYLQPRERLEELLSDLSLG